MKTTIVENFYNRTKEYLLAKHPGATLIHQDFPLTSTKTNLTEKIARAYVAFDMKAGIKYRLIAMQSFGRAGDTKWLLTSVNNIYEILGGVYIGEYNAINATGTPVNTSISAYSPRLEIYTNKLCAPIVQIISEFGVAGHQIEIVDESAMYKSVFISYGGPDSAVVSDLNNELKKAGVETWFFPDNALPGQKLHRVMHEGANKYEKVLLICSESSLNRSGVLNEIERVLEREAREGGSDILMPVTLDDYVFNGWDPERSDLADQVKARVIVNLGSSDRAESIKKLTESLRIR